MNAILINYVETGEVVASINSTSLFSMSYSSFQKSHKVGKNPCGIGGG